MFTKVRHLGYYSLLVAASLVILGMNVMTTLKGDEYVYRLIPGEMRYVCATVGDYVHSIPMFYQQTNGRLADIIERFFASLVGKGWLFNLLNTGMFALLAHGLVTLALRRRREVLALTLVLVCLAFAFPMPGETLLWMAGSFNYLWSATLAVWLLVWLRGHDSATAARHALVFVCAMLVGWLNESTTVSCVAGLVIYYVLNPRHFVGPRRTALAGQLAGLAVIMLSPALWHRLDQGEAVNMSLSVAQMFSRRILAVGYMSLRFVTPVLVAVLCVGTWHRGGWRTVRRNPGYCMVAGALLILLALGMLIERPYTLYVCLCVAVALRAFFPALMRIPVATRRMLVTALLTLLVLCGALTLKQQSDYRAYDDDIHRQIAAGPQQCVLQASAPPVSSRWIMPDVYDNTVDGCAYRTFYAHCHGKQNVQFLPPDLYARYRAGRMLDGAHVAPFVSNTPALADTLLAFVGQDYALVPLKPGLATSNGMGGIYLKDLGRAYDDRVCNRRYWLGSLNGFVPFRPYWLVLDGRTYQVVTGEVTDQVIKIEMNLYRNRQWQTLTFTRVN